MAIRLPLRRALLFIALSTALVTGTMILLWVGWHYVKKSQQSDPRYTITAIAQRCLSGEPLSTLYLAEIWALAIDRPTNLYQFDLESAQNAIMSHPAIKEARLQRLPPQTLWVEYSVRNPVAFVRDLADMAIDEEGIPFPLHPFFTPKQLPKIYLGIKEEELGPFCRGELAATDTLSKRLHCALEILHKAQDVVSLSWIDISKVDEPNWGQRQIVLGIHRGSRFHLLRMLSVGDLSTVLRRYLLLIPHLICYDQLTTIDMRIPHLAFISTGNEG